MMYVSGGNAGNPGVSGLQWGEAGDRAIKGDYKSVKI